MNDSSSMMLIGIGTAGCAMARGVSRAFGDGLRYLLVDTDAASALDSDGESFTLLGGDRLAGRGAGGDVVSARLAAEDSIRQINSRLEGVRLAIIVTALGGGTGGGVTLEAAKHLMTLGIPTVVFATTPFEFEGEGRMAKASSVMAMIEEAANATFLLPLDNLIAGADQMNEALARAIGTVASGVTLFWRLVGKPGYLRLDVERIRHVLQRAGRGRFATVTAQGPDRAAEALAALRNSPLLRTEGAPVRTILCGVLAGDDLRLKEISLLAQGLRGAFGEHADFELATVNDEQTFCGRLSVVVMLFENTAKFVDEAAEARTGAGAGVRRPVRRKTALSGVGASNRGRFSNAEPTTWQGVNLDTPTYLRYNLSLEF